MGFNSGFKGLMRQHFETTRKLKTKCGTFMGKKIRREKFMQFSITPVMSQYSLSAGCRVPRIEKVCPRPYPGTLTN